MIRKAAFAAIITSLLSLPVYAQDWSTSSGDSGSGGRETSSTGTQGMAPDDTDNTGPQNQTRRNMGRNSGPGFALNDTSLPIGAGQGLARVSGPRGRNGLPPTRLDSFVKEAGGHAWHIYGDEGTYSIPPFFEFSPIHRIERGITGARAAGITTQHGSPLPPAWGGDEFVDTEGFTQSGAPYQQINPLFGITPPDLGLGNSSGRSNFGFNVNGTPVNGGFNPNTGGFRGSVNTGLGTFGGTYNPGTGTGSVRIPGGSGFSFP
ncbi:MAG: hypothetical protein IT342_27145 [Candidatus Melainabacteria bacterium]|nr:hypothetical protein [Candidatus Melainabacteria bacterium]